MTPEAGLKLAADHMRDTLGPLEHLWLRPGWQNIYNSSLLMRWDFPTGGTISLSFDFDIKLDGDRGHLVPASRLSASLGSHLEESIIFVEMLGRVTAAAQRALLLMRTQSYEP